MVDDSDRSLVTRPDGSITLAKSKQRFYDVATWSAMAMVSAKQFCELAAKLRGSSNCEFQLAGLLVLPSNSIPQVQEIQVPKSLVVRSCIPHDAAPRKMDVGNLCARPVRIVPFGKQQALCVPTSLRSQDSQSDCVTAVGTHSPCFEHQSKEDMDMRLIQCRGCLHLQPLPFSTPLLPVHARAPSCQVPDSKAIMNEKMGSLHSLASLPNVGKVVGR